MNNLDNNRVKNLVEKMSLDFKKNKSDHRTQELVKKMRKLNEQNEEDNKRENKEVVSDQGSMEKWFRDYFRGLDIIVEFGDLKVFNDLVFWDGMIDGVIQFIFVVSNDPELHGVEFVYADDIDIQNPVNNEISKKVEDFFVEFSEFWKRNVLNA
jgi:hypothetical protein